MQTYVVIVFCGFVLASNAFNFRNEDDIYRSRFSNCTLQEENEKQCINGVCIARTDTLERLALCICLEGYWGARCEASELPFLPMTLECKSYNIGMFIGCSIIILILFLSCIVSLFIYYKTKRNIYQPPLPV